MVDIEELEDILHREKMREPLPEYEGQTAKEWHEETDKIIKEYVPYADKKVLNITEYGERVIRPRLEINRLLFAEEIIEWQLRALFWGCMYPVALLIFWIIIASL